MDCFFYMIIEVCQFCTNIELLKALKIVKKYFVEGLLKVILAYLIYFLISKYLNLK